MGPRGSVWRGEGGSDEGRRKLNSAGAGWGLLDLSSYANKELEIDLLVGYDRAILLPLPCLMGDTELGVEGDILVAGSVSRGTRQPEKDVLSPSLPRCFSSIVPRSPPLENRVRCVSVWCAWTSHKLESARQPQITFLPSSPPRMLKGEGGDSSESLKNRAGNSPAPLPLSKEGRPGDAQSSNVQPGSWLLTESETQPRTCSGLAQRV